MLSLGLGITQIHTEGRHCQGSQGSGSQSQPLVSPPQVPDRLLCHGQMQTQKQSVALLSLG